MIDRVAPQRPYAKDDLALLKRNSPLNTRHENEMRVLRQAARAASENRPVHPSPRFLTSEQWKYHPQANGDPHPLLSAILTADERHALGMRTQKMNRAMRVGAGKIGDHKGQASAVVKGLAKLRDAGFKVSSGLTRGDTSLDGPGGKKLEEGLKWHDKAVISTTVNPVVAERYATNRYTGPQKTDYKENWPYISYFPYVPSGVDIQDVHHDKGKVQEVLLPAGMTFETLIHAVGDDNFLVHRVVQHQSDLPEYAGVNRNDPHLMPYDPAAAVRRTINALPPHAGQKTVTDRHMEGLKKVADSLWLPPAPNNGATDQQNLQLNLSLALHVLGPGVIQKTLQGYARTPHSAAQLQETFSNEVAGPASDRVLSVLAQYGGALTPDLKSALQVQLAREVFRPVPQDQERYGKILNTLPEQTRREQLTIELKGIPLSGLEAMTLHDKNLPATLPKSIREVMAKHFTDELFEKHSRRTYIPERHDLQRNGVAVPRSHEILTILDDFKRLAKEVFDQEIHRATPPSRQRDPAQTAAQQEAHEYHKKSLATAIQRMSSGERAQFERFLTDDEAERTQFEQYLTSDGGPLKMMAREQQDDLLHPARVKSEEILEGYEKNTGTLRIAMRRMSDGERAQLDQYLTADNRARLEQYLMLDMRESMARDLKNALHPDLVDPRQILDAYEKALREAGQSATLAPGQEAQLLEDLRKAMQPLTLDKLLQMTRLHIPEARVPELNTRLNDILKRHKLQLLQRQLDQLPATQQEDFLASLETGLERAAAEEQQIKEEVRALIDRYRGPAMQGGDARPGLRRTALQTRIAALDTALGELQGIQRQIDPDPDDLARLEQGLDDIRAAAATEEVSTPIARSPDPAVDGGHTRSGPPPSEAGDRRVTALVAEHQRTRAQLAESLARLGHVPRFLDFPEIIRHPGERVLTKTERDNYQQSIAQLIDELTRYLQTLPAKRETERDQAANFLANILGEPAVGADLQRQARALLTTLADINTTDDPSPARLKRCAKYFGAFRDQQDPDMRMSARVRNALSPQRARSEKHQLELLEQLDKQIVFLPPADRTEILLDLLETQKDLPLRRVADFSADPNVSVSKSIARLVKTQCFEGWGKEDFDSAAIFQKFVSVMPRAAAATVINRNDVEGTYLRLVREYMASSASALPREQRIALLPSLLQVSGELNPRRGPVQRSGLRPVVNYVGFPAVTNLVIFPPLISLFATMGPAAATALVGTVASSGVLAGVGAVLAGYKIAKHMRPAAREEIANCLDEYLAMKDIPASAGPFDRARAALPLAPVWANVLDQLAQDPTIGVRKGILKDRSRQDKQLGYFLAQSDIEQYRNLPEQSANESMRQAITAWAPALASLVPLLPSLKNKPHAGERMSLQEQAIANLEKLLAACAGLPDEQQADALQAQVPVFDALRKVVNELSDKPQRDGKPSLRQWAQTKLADYDNNLVSSAPAWAATLDVIRQSSAESAGNQVPDRDNRERWVSRFLEQSAMGRGGRAVDAWAPAFASLIALVPQLNNKAPSEAQAGLRDRAIAGVDQFINALDALPAHQQAAALPALVPVWQALGELLDKFGLVEKLDGRVAAWARRTLQRVELIGTTAEPTIYDMPVSLTGEPRERPPQDQEVQTGHTAYLDWLAAYDFAGGDSDVTNQAASAAIAGQNDATRILGTKLPNAASFFGNGELYQGTDGIRRHVEFFDDPARAYGKVLTNALLNDLGARAPQSEVIHANGRTGYAAIHDDDIRGPIAETGLTKEHADAVLNSCVVDILLKNWDAVGNDRRNLAMTTDGQVIRANNDVALPTHAKGMRKPPKHLDKTADYVKNLFDPKINPAYAAIARAAGYDRVRDVPTFHAQIGRIEELLHARGGWDNYVTQTLPGLNEEDRRELAGMLESRTSELRKLAARYHAKRDELNRYLPILHPTTPSDPATWTDRTATAVFSTASGYPRMLNGVEMAPWEAPTTLDGWAAVAGQNPQCNGIPFKVHAENKAAAGALILEPDGRIWMTEPSNHYGGETHTFPKGKVDPGLSLQQTAIKEVYEETGLQVEITGVLGDYDGGNRTTRFFIARRVGGTPEDMGWETQAEHLMPLDRAARRAAPGRDRGIMRDLRTRLSQPASGINWPTMPVATPQPAGGGSHLSPTIPAPPASAPPVSEPASRIALPARLATTPSPANVASRLSRPTPSLAGIKGKQPVRAAHSTGLGATTPQALRHASDAYQAIWQHFEQVQDRSITGPLTEPVVGLALPTAPPAQQSARHKALFDAFTASETAVTRGNDALLTAWLNRQGIRKVFNSGRGNNCLIRALLHHATGNHEKQFYVEVDAYRRQLEAKFPNVLRGEQLNAFSAETQFLVRQINQDYGVNLKPAFVQSSDGGKPYVTVVETGSTLVPIWYSSNHYEAMTMAPAAAGPSVTQP